MQRFFLDWLVLWVDKFFLSHKDLIHQITKVLRSKVWDEMIFFDESYDYRYKIIDINKKYIVFSFLSKIKKDNFKKNIVLYQRIPNKISKIEFILQKWVEVWIREFIFFKAQRSQRINFSRNKLERFEKIIKEAVEQSNQNYIPKITFVSFLDFEKITWLNLFFHTDSFDSKRLNEVSFKDFETINLFVWPEWWYTKEEEQIFLKNKFIKINLWTNILRTETVWIVVSFFINQN